MSETATSSNERPQAMPRFVMIILGVAGLLISLVLMKEFANIVGPIFLALNLVLTAYPIFTWLRGKGTPRWLAAATMAVVVVVVLLLLVGGLVWAIAEIVAEVPSYSDEVLAAYHTVLDWLRNFPVTENIAKTMQEGGANIDLSTITSVVGGLAGSILSSFASVGTLVGVIVISLFFFAMDASGFSTRMKLTAIDFPSFSRSMGSFAKGVRKYWLVSTVFGLIVAIVDGVALVFLDVPLPLVWALISFITNYIPNIGFIVGLIPPALLAAINNGWQTALAVVIIYCVANFVIQSLIQPRFAGESVGVTATVSFISLLVWGYVLGALGTILALPMTLLVKALLVDADPKAHWIDVLISSDPVQVSQSRFPRGKAKDNREAPVAVVPTTPIESN